MVCLPFTIPVFEKYIGQHLPVLPTQLVKSPISKPIFSQLWDFSDVIDIKPKMDISTTLYEFDFILIIFSAFLYDFKAVLR
jgi:hypothetical protein